MHVEYNTNKSRDADGHLMNLGSGETVIRCSEGADYCSGRCGGHCSRKDVGRDDDPGKTCGKNDHSGGSESSSSGENSSSEWSDSDDDGATGNKSSGRALKSFVSCRKCCCGNCNGCCHGDCGRYGHFDYHDDYGRSGELVGNGSGRKNKAGAPRPPPDNRWQDGHLQECPGGSMGETSYVASKLKFESSRLEDALNYPEHLLSDDLFFSELRTKAISLVRQVDKAVAKLERLEVLHEELYSSRQLLRFQKARNKRLQEDYMRLEMQLTEVNKDYGQLLVECDIKDQTLAKKLMAQDSRCQTLLEKSTQTEQLGMVDVGKLSCPSNNTLSTQTEVCVDKKVGIRSDAISPVKGNVEKQVSSTSK